MYKFLSLLLVLSISFSTLMAENNSTKNTTIKSSKNKSSVSDEELKLMYQIFIYKTELESAYKVAKKALKHEPYSLDWHRKMADVSMWTGRSREAMMHHMFVYEQKPTKELRDKLIKTSLTYYQYDKAKSLIKNKMFENPNKENIDLFSYIWQESGEPEAAADELYELYEQDNSIYALEQSLSIYAAVGSFEKVEALLAVIKKENISSDVILKKVANYQYSLQDIESSYKTLVKMKSKKLNDEKYLAKLCDLGWYLGDFNNAVKASLRLDTLGKARPQDYERIIAMSSQYPSEAMNAALHSWKKYHKPNNFYTYAYLVLESKEYSRLLTLCDEVEASNYFEYFKSDPIYYLIKAQAYQLSGNTQQAKSALLMALKLRPNDSKILAQIIWLYMDAKETLALKDFIYSLEKNSIPYELYLPLASAHFYLQEADRSKAYLFKILKREPNNIDIKLLYSYILQVENEPQAFMNQMQEIDRMLEKQKRSNSSLMQNSEFLDRYLRVQIYLINPDSFVSLLKRSKQYMKPENYANIAFLWSLRNNAHEQARVQLRQMQKVESWMLLNQALHLRDNTSLQTLLYKYYVELPIRDRVDAAIRSGNLAFGYTLAFDGMQMNRRDELLYQQFKQYAQDRGDLFTATPGTVSRDDLKQKYLLLKNRYYMAHGYWLYAGLELYGNTLDGTDTLAYVLSNETIFSLGLKKEFDRGSVFFGAGYRDSMDDYIFAKIAFDWKLNNRFDLLIKGGYRDKAEETTYLLLGGNKDYGSFNLTYTLLPSIQLSIGYEKANYYSQDNVDLGDGSITRLGIQKVFRIGYPDIATSLFAEFGRFNENDGSKGVIDKLLPEPATVLPFNFNNYGVTFNYGMQNRTIYTRVWRPYFEISPFYDSETDDFSYSVSGGIGGSLYNQDHAVMGFDYSQAVNGTDESSLRLFIQYQLLY